MKGKTGGVRRWEVVFDKAGTLTDDTGLASECAAAHLTDLIVISHGWNSSVGSARSLYDDLFGRIAAMLPPGRRETAGFAGVLWPSLLFPEDEPADDGPVVRPAGSAQGLDDAPADAAPPPPASGTELAAALAPSFPGHEAELAEIGRLLEARMEDGAALDRFHTLVRSLVTTPDGAEEDRGEEPVVSGDTYTVLEAMADLAPPTDGGAAQGIDVFGKLWSGAREALRTASYYEMKNRAGVVGARGLGPLLGRLASGDPALRIHLVGHSFGARLVSYALSGLPDGCRGGRSPVKSLTLLQGAFSHFAFAPTATGFDRPGALAAFTDRVDGPLVATFTAADRAVGWWYPNASRLARQGTQGAESLNYRWGGMGHDGFQPPDAAPRAPVTRPLGPQGTAYGFAPGGFYRLDANKVINRELSWFAGAHSDIRRPEVAWAVVAAAGLG